MFVPVAWVSLGQPDRNLAVCVCGEEVSQEAKSLALPLILGWGTPKA